MRCSRTARTGGVGGCGCQARKKRNESINAYCSTKATVWQGQGLNRKQWGRAGVWPALAGGGNPTGVRSEIIDGDVNCHSSGEGNTQQMYPESVSVVIDMP